MQDQAIQKAEYMNAQNVSGKVLTSKRREKKDNLSYVHICPHCGNEEFYSLIKNQK